MDKYAQNLIKSEPLRKPLLKEIISTLDFPIGSHGLDIGCGIGLQVPLLLHAIGERGFVTGMDTSESFLETAKLLAIQTKISKQTNFHSCSWENLPFKSDTFDWAWSIDAVGYAGLESECIFQEIARVLKPGGKIVLAYWSSQTLLPGYPKLEAKLNASPAGIAPFQDGATPESHFMNTQLWMRRAGLLEIVVKSFIRTITTPLNDDLKIALISLLSMRWGDPIDHLTSEEWSTYQQICDPSSSKFILDNPDYYAFFTYSVFSGFVPPKT